MSYSVELRIGVVFFVLFASLLGVSLPQIVQPKTFVEVHFTLFKSFGVGIILATSFAHVLHDGVVDLAETGVDFPVALTLALLAIVIMFFSEQAIKALNETPSDVHGAKALSFERVSEDGKVAVVGAAAARHHHLPQQSDSTSASLVHLLQLGIAAHSIAIGIVLGIATGREDALALTVAICFHQLFEGAGLGVALVDARFSRARMLVNSAIFVCTTPFGLALGIGLEDRLDEGSLVYLWTSGAVNSLAAGFLIYFGLVNMLVADFNRADLKGKHGLRLAMASATMVGIATMVILAIWA